MTLSMKSSLCLSWAYLSNPVYRRLQPRTQWGQRERTKQSNEADWCKREAKRTGNVETRRPLCSLCQLSKEPAGVMQMLSRRLSKKPTKNPPKKQIQPKHVSTVTLCGPLAGFIIHLQTSLEAPGHIFRERKHPWEVWSSRTGEQR